MTTIVLIVLCIALLISLLYNWRHIFDIKALNESISFFRSRYDTNLENVQREHQILFDELRQTIRENNAIHELFGIEDFVKFRESCGSKYSPLTVTEFNCGVGGVIKLSKPLVFVPLYGGMAEMVLYNEDLDLRIDLNVAREIFGFGVFCKAIDRPSTIYTGYRLKAFNPMIAINCSLSSLFLFIVMNYNKDKFDYLWKSVFFTHMLSDCDVSLTALKLQKLIANFDEFLKVPNFCWLFPPDIDIAEHDTNFRFGIRVYQFGGDKKINFSQAITADFISNIREKNILSNFLLSRDEPDVLFEIANDYISVSVSVETYKHTDPASLHELWMLLSCEFNKHLHLYIEGRLPSPGPRLDWSEASVSENNSKGV